MFAHLPLSARCPESDAYMGHTGVNVTSEFTLSFPGHSRAAKPRKPAQTGAYNCNQVHQLIPEWVTEGYTVSVLYRYHGCGPQSDRTNEMIRPEGLDHMQQLRVAFPQLSLTPGLLVGR